MTLPGRKAFLETFSSSLIIQGLTIVSGVLTARILGPEGRGVFAAATVWPTVLASLGYLGTNYTLSRLAATERDTAPLTSDALGLSVVLSAITIVTGWLLLPHSIPETEPTTLHLAQVFLLYVPLNIATTVLLSIDLGSQRIRWYNAVRISLQPIYLVLLLAIFASGSNSVIWAIYALLTANALVLGIRLAVDNRHITLRVSYKFCVQTIRQSLGYFLTSSWTVLVSQFDRIFLMWLLPPWQFGLYIVALTVARVHIPFSRSAGLIVFSRGVSLRGENGNADAAKAFRVLSIVALVLVAATALAIPLGIPLLYGHAFTLAVPAALWLLFGALFESLSMPLEEGLKAQGKPVLVFVGVVLSLAVFATGCYIGSDDLSLIQVAVSLGLGKAVSLFFLCAIFSKKDRAVLLPRREDLLLLLREARRLLPGRRNNTGF